MKRYARPTTALVLVASLTACGKQAVAPQPAMPLQTAAQARAAQVTAAGTATVLGALNDVDWYVVISAQDRSVKPLVVQMPSKPECDRGVAEFSLKAVNPAAPDAEPPKAWCVVGKDVRARLGV
jgi:hypothetical protein